MENDEEKNGFEIPSPRKLFTFNRDGIEETAQLERWKWIAFYGSENDKLEQFDEETGIFHEFSEIEQARLDYFVMISTEDPRKRVFINFPKGARLIHYYRQSVLNFGTPQQVKFTIYCFGYAETIEGKSKKMIMMIYPDDSIHVETDDGKE